MAVNTWKVQAFRLAVYTAPGQSSPSTDSAYVDALARAVKVATDDLEVYVIVSIQLDPSNYQNNQTDRETQEEIPNSGLVKVWQKLVPAFATNPRVLFGISNEPHCPDQGRCEIDHDEQVRQGMASIVRAIRKAETASRSPYPHVVLAQGCRNYAANISCYQSEGGGLLDPQIAYEVHMYNAPLVFKSYEAQVFSPARKIPVIIGEIGPQKADGTGCQGHMSFANLQEVLRMAEDNQVPYFGWMFHSKCPPDMLTSRAVCNSCLQSTDNIYPSDDSISPGSQSCLVDWGCFAYKWLVTLGNKSTPEGVYLTCRSSSSFPTAPGPMGP